MFKNSRNLLRFVRIVSLIMTGLIGFDQNLLYAEDCTCWCLLDAGAGSKTCQFGEDPPYFGESGDCGKACALIANDMGNPLIKSYCDSNSYNECWGATNKPSSEWKQASPYSGSPKPQRTFFKKAKGD